MTDKTLITFAIPTYNGSKYLPQAIDSVLKDVHESGLADVEVLISDNCSTDSTAVIAADFQAKYPGVVSYYRNDQNIGYDRNLDLAIRRAKGEYVWLLGDDDYLAPGGVAVIHKKLSALKEPKPAVLLAPVAFLDITTKELRDPLCADKDVFCADGNVFFQTTLWKTAAMSSVIVLRQAWTETDIREFFGGQWIHLGGLIKVLKHGSAIVLNSPVVVVRTSNPRWVNNNGNHLLLGMAHVEVLSALDREGYSPETFAKFVDLRFSTNFVSILAMKPLNPVLILKIALSMVKYFYSRPSFWLLHLPTLLFFPNFPFLKRWGKKFFVKA